MVETIRLESGHTLTGIVGSNPTLSAITLFPQDTRLLAGTIDENPRPKMWLERGQKEKPTSA